MGDLLGFVLSGLVSGALYALLATGLVLSYSASGLFNFAHGATAYLCALAFHELHSGFGRPAVPTALLLVCVVAPALGWGLDRLMFRKLARVGETAQIVATIGLLVALPAAGLWVVELLERAGAPVQPAENQFGLPRDRAEPGGVVAAARRRRHRLRPADHLARDGPGGGRAVGLDAAHPARAAAAGGRRQPLADGAAGCQRGPAVLDRLDAVLGSRGPRRGARDPAPRPLRPRLHALPLRLRDRGGARALPLGAARLRGRARARGAAEPGGGVRVVRRGHHRLPDGGAVPDPLSAASSSWRDGGARRARPPPIRRRSTTSPGRAGSAGGAPGSWRARSSRRPSTRSPRRSGRASSRRASRSGSCSCRSRWSRGSARWCRWPRRRS
ncbi:hypothetical protein SNARM312S_07004 [Streptomyces narbonensis]